MLTSLQNTLEIYMFSPLDQFGDDDSSVGLLDNMLTDLIPNVWYLAKLLNFASYTIAESSMTSSPVQASTAITNILGMALALEAI